MFVLTIKYVYNQSTYLLYKKKNLFDQPKSIDIVITISRTLI